MESLSNDVLACMLKEHKFSTEGIQEFKGIIYIRKIGIHY